MTPNQIQRHSFVTKNGNSLELFYNPEIDLIVLDLIAANGKSGNELLRQTLDEVILLRHSTVGKW